MKELEHLIAVYWNDNWNKHEIRAEEFDDPTTLELAKNIALSDPADRSLSRRDKCRGNVLISWCHQIRQFAQFAALKRIQFTTILTRQIDSAFCGELLEQILMSAIG